MQVFYARVGVTRQAHQQWLRSHLSQKIIISKIREEVIFYRSNFDFRAGSRMLFYNLKIKERYDIGVNKFEQLLSSEGLSLPVNRVRVITTRSSMQSWNYNNLTFGLKIYEINKVFVGDITYVFHNGGRYFFFSYIDVYSGRIIGWSFDNNMKAERALETLQMATECRGMIAFFDAINHTDGGGQYYSRLYLERASILGLRMSRARNCLENGNAEQFNGYFKHHILPLVKSKTLGGMKKEIATLLHHYNFERKQEKLGWLSPVEFENEQAKSANPVVINLHDFNKKED